MQQAYFEIKILKYIPYHVYAIRKDDLLIYSSGQEKAGYSSGKSVPPHSIEVTNLSPHPAPPVIRY